MNGEYTGPGPAYYEPPEPETPDALCIVCGEGHFNEDRPSHATGSVIVDASSTCPGCRASLLWELMSKAEQEKLVEYMKFLGLMNAQPLDVTKP